MTVDALQFYLDHKFGDNYFTVLPQIVSVIIDHEKFYANVAKSPENHIFIFPGKSVKEIDSDIESFGMILHCKRAMPKSGFAAHVPWDVNPYHYKNDTFKTLNVTRKTCSAASEYCKYKELTKTKIIAYEDVDIEEYWNAGYIEYPRNNYVPQVHKYKATKITTIDLTTNEVIERTIKDELVRDKRFTGKNYSPFNEGL